MPRGGARPGAGRKRRPAAPPVAAFDLAERLHCMPAGPIGRQRRVVLTMASYGVPAAHIAAALAIDEPRLREFFGVDLRDGQILAEANIIAGVWTHARAGHGPSSLYLCRRFDRLDRVEQQR